MKKILFGAILSLFTITAALGQNKGTITVYCFEQSTHENMDSVKLSLYRNDTLISTVFTDVYGGHDFKKMPAGAYSIKYSLPGYGSGTATVQLQPDGTSNANIGLMKSKPKSPVHKKK